MNTKALYDEFIKDMGQPGTVWGMPDYIVWLEQKLLAERRVQPAVADVLPKCPNCVSGWMNINISICGVCGHEEHN